MENLCGLFVDQEEPASTRYCQSRSLCGAPSREVFGSDGLNFELQGTGGVVEVRNSHGEGNWGQGRLSIATSTDGGNSRDNTEPEWLDLQTALATEEFDADMPAAYRAGSAELEQATQSGHGGSDFFCTATFLAALRGGTQPVAHESHDHCWRLGCILPRVPAMIVRAGEGGVGVPAVGIHEAMDMTLPGLCSQLSIAQGGA